MNKIKTEILSKDELSKELDSPLIDGDSIICYQDQLGRYWAVQKVYVCTGAEGFRSMVVIEGAAILESEIDSILGEEGA